MVTNATIHSRIHGTARAVEDVFPPTCTALHEIGFTPSPLWSSEALALTTTGNVEIAKVMFCCSSSSEQRLLIPPLVAGLPLCKGS